MSRYEGAPGPHLSIPQDQPHHTPYPTRGTPSHPLPEIQSCRCLQPLLCRPFNLLLPTPSPTGTASPKLLPDPHRGHPSSLTSQQCLLRVTIPPAALLLSCLGFPVSQPLRLLTSNDCAPAPRHPAHRPTMPTAAAPTSSLCLQLTPSTVIPQGLQSPVLVWPGGVQCADLSILTTSLRWVPWPSSFLILSPRPHLCPVLLPSPGPDPLLPGENGSSQKGTPASEPPNLPP